MPIKVSLDFLHALRNQFLYFGFVTNNKISIEKSAHSFEGNTKEKICAKFKRKIRNPTLPSA